MYQHAYHAASPRSPPRLPTPRVFRVPPLTLAQRPRNVRLMFAATPLTLAGPVWGGLNSLRLAGSPLTTRGVGSRWASCHFALPNRNSRTSKFIHNHHESVGWYLGKPSYSLLSFAHCLQSSCTRRICGQTPSPSILAPFLANSG